MTGLIIDNFAGGGGASTGIERALGRPVDYAINHDADALAMHAANHPATVHIQEDVFRVSPRELCAGRHVALAWFSPDCTFHSRANAGKPIARGRRGLAGVALKWAHQVRPQVIVTENVREFRDWGPLVWDATARRWRPDPARKGQHFERWVSRLSAMGYAVEWRMVVAADHGAPTTRERLIIVARCDGQIIQWPVGTSAWVPAARVIDVDAPVVPWGAKKRAKATMENIARGRERFGSEPWLLSYYGNAGLYPLSRPLATVTTHDRFALIRHDGMRMLTARELADAQGFPAGYRLPAVHAQAVYFIGNSVCPPVAEAIVRANCASPAAGEATA